MARRSAGQTAGAAERDATSPSRSCFVLIRELPFPPMPDAEKLHLANPQDLASALAFALRFEGRKRVHNANEIMAEIVAKRLVAHLERAGFVVLQRGAVVGGAALGRGHESG
jgi:hypothetical protein